MNFVQWKKRGQYFSYREQYKIFYQSAGTGQNLLLLHGFPTASWDWNKIWPSLISQFRTLAPDFIGFGFSDKPRPYAYSIMDQADLIEALLTEKGIKQFHVLAHDYGDTVLQELLARFIERENPPWQIQTITLLNGGIFPEAHQPRLIQQLLISPFGKLLTPFLSKRMLDKNFRAIFGKATPPSVQEIEEFYALIEHQNGKYIFHRLIRYMRERRIHRERWAGALQNCPVPLRLINGLADPISGQLMVERFAEIIDDADIIRLEQIGHYPQTEAPGLVLKHFLDFVDA